MSQILYVDDEKSSIVVFQHSFRDFDIITARSGLEALSVLSKNKNIVAVFTDQKMPGMTGCELLGQIQLQHPGVHRYIVSAYLEKETRSRVLSSSLARGWIMKPWDHSEILKALQEVTNGNGSLPCDEKIRILKSNIKAADDAISFFACGGFRR